MATTRQSGTKRSSSRSSAAKRSPARASSGSRSRSTGASRSNGASRSSGSTRPSRPARSGGSSRARAQSNGVVGGARKVVSKVGTPLIAGGAAAAGLAGGIVLGAKSRGRKRRFGFGRGVDLSSAVQQVGKAAQQFGDVTKELRRAGEQAEKMGKKLS